MLRVPRAGQLCLARNRTVPSISFSDSIFLNFEALGISDLPIHYSNRGSMT